MVIDKESNFKFLLGLLAITIVFVMGCVRIMHLPEDQLEAGQWTLIDGGEDAVRVALAGHPLMRRNWTWMCDVYARR